jgi:hypothetical protein
VETTLKQGFSTQRNTRVDGIQEDGDAASQPSSLAIRPSSPVSRFAEVWGQVSVSHLINFDPGEYRQGCLDSSDLDM